MPIEGIEIVVTDRGTKIVRRNLENVGKSARKAQSGVTLLKTALGGFSALAVFAVLKAGVKTALAFSDALAEVSTLVEGTAKEMKLLKTAALEQAKAFGTQPVEQVKALYQIISAGAESATRATETLTAANKLAVGGVTDIETAADGLTTVMNSYGQEAGTATDISDTFFVAMKAGKTTIDQLANSLGKVAPLAASAGASFDETAAAVAALTKGGISTNEAITGLRGVLAAVVKPTEEARKQAKALGLEFSAAALKSKGLAVFLEEVRQKTKGNTEVLAQLFGGVEALVPVLALTGKSAKDFADTLENMKNKAGATEKAFNKIAKSPGFQIGRLMAAISGEMIKAMDAVLAVIGPFAKFLADNFDLISSAVRTLVFIILANLVGSAIPKMILLLPKVALALRAIIPALRALTAAFLANPLTFLPTIIAIGISALYEFPQALGVVTGLVGSLLDKIGGFFQALWDKVVSLFSFLPEAFRKWVGEAIDTAIAAVTRAINFIRKLLGSAVNEIKNETKSITDGLGNNSNSNNGNSSSNRGNSSNNSNDSSSDLGALSGAESRTATVGNRSNEFGPKTSLFGPATRGFGPGGGGGSGFKSTGNAIKDILGGFNKRSALTGFNSGGSFRIAGRGGIDTNLLSINNQPVVGVTKGETVQVIPKSSNSGGGVRASNQPSNVTNITFNITTPDADSFQASMGQIQSEIQSTQNRANRRLG